MSPRPLPVTVAAILLALFSLMNFPGPWWYAVPGAAEVTPMFVVYSGIVLGIVGIVAAVGLWMLKTWSLWLTIVVCVQPVSKISRVSYAKPHEKGGNNR